uniref:Deacetylase sirtuin-type domain-containing protein n=1 Tax=Macrostomum lignano TaxID=282301 RepID=A0A1I8FK17_9PLAT
PEALLAQVSRLRPQQPHRLPAGLRPGPPIWSEQPSVSGREAPLRRRRQWRIPLCCTLGTLRLFVSRHGQARPLQRPAPSHARVLRGASSNRANSAPPALVPFGAPIFALSLLSCQLPGNGGLYVQPALNESPLFWTLCNHYRCPLDDVLRHAGQPSFDFEAVCAHKAGARDDVVGAGSLLLCFGRAALLELSGPGSTRSCALDRKRLTETRVLQAKSASLSLTARLLRGRAVRAARRSPPHRDARFCTGGFRQKSSSWRVSWQAAPRRKGCVVYTGAGVSTAADIPDYRGPLTACGRGCLVAPCRASACPAWRPPGPPLRTASSLHWWAAQSPQWLRQRKAQPPQPHRCVTPELLTSYFIIVGWSPSRISFIIFGWSPSLLSFIIIGWSPRRLSFIIIGCRLSELHGNVFVEACELCGRLVRRRFDVTERSRLRRHDTAGVCGSGGCTGRLLDTIVHFGEFGRRCTADRVYEWRAAEAAASRARLILCLGTSLQFFPLICHPPFLPPPGAAPLPSLWPPGTPLAIVNLQATPFDRRAQVAIGADCDSGCAGLAVAGSGAPPASPRPDYRPAADPLLAASEPLLDEAEKKLVSRPDIVVDSEVGSAIT